MSDLSTAIAYLKRIHKTDPTDHAYRADICATPFNEDAAVFYLIDDGDSYNFATRRDLQAASLTVEELHKVGIDNLRHEVSKLNFVDGPNGTKGLTGISDFVASAILLTDVWEQHYPDGMAAAIPARDVFVSCDLANNTGVEHLRQFVSAIGQREQTHPISNRIHALKDGQLELLDGPVHEANGDLRIRDVAMRAFEQANPSDPRVRAKDVRATVFLRPGGRDPITYEMTFDSLTFVGVEGPYALFHYDKVLAKIGATPTLEDLSDEEVVLVNELIEPTEVIEIFDCSEDERLLRIAVGAAGEGCGLAIGSYSIHPFELR